MISIKDQKPQDKQPIWAETPTQGRVSGIAHYESNGGVIVLFDFYSGTGFDEIISWEERIPPNEPNAHPWTGIHNTGK